MQTTYNDFARTSLTQGYDVLRRWTGAHHEIGGFISGTQAQDLEIVPLFATFSVPSGTISAECFERIARELLHAIEERLPLDGLLIALHGATVSEQFPDADGEVLLRIRTLLGPDVLIVNTLDLHANISADMARFANATIVYRSNPHLDQEQRGEEAAQLLGRALRKEVQLTQALETPPMIIQMCRQYTSEDPARKLYKKIDEVLQWPGVLSASIAMGFYFADVNEMGASFLAVTNGDLNLARKAARHLSESAWAIRHELIGNLPSPAEAVRTAKNARETPVVLMDTGDNIGGGGPGDSTVLFWEILRQNAENALVILHDPEAVKQCLETGPGGEIVLLAGGKTDTRYGPPVPVQGRVRALSDGQFTDTQVRHGGWGGGNQGITAVVETREQHTVVLTSRRMAPMSLDQILSLGIYPDRKRILIVKGVVAPRAAYEPVAGKVIVVDTPGITSDDPRQFPYQLRRVPLFPLELETQYSRTNL